MERRFGRYTVIATLGSGAMGEVLRARDERLGREVAVKTVRNLFGMQAEVFRMRFEAEARALATMSHPAIVQIHDLGVEDGEPYLVMELVDGPSLKERLAAGPMAAAEVRAMGIQLARGLEAAHRRHILHRDIKPANILLSPTGQWKLADFGVARVPESEMTVTGQFLGTPAYAAPEALTLGEFSEKSDVFGLAVTLVEALTGARLRGNATLSELVQRSADAIVLPPEVPAMVAGALRPALARDPARRPTAGGFAELLAAGEVPSDGTAILQAGPVPIVASGSTPAGPEAARPEPPRAPVGALGSLAAAPSPSVSGWAATSLPGAASASVSGWAATSLPGSPAPSVGAVRPSHTPTPTPSPLPVALPSPPRTAGPPRRTTWLVAGIVGTLGVVGLIAALSRGGDRGTDAAPTATPPVTAPGALAVEPAVAADEPIDELADEREPERVLPPIVPGRVTIVYPRNLDQASYQAYARVVDLARAQQFARALSALDAFEAAHGGSVESRHLRAQLDALPASRRGDD